MRKERIFYGSVKIWLRAKGQLLNYRSTAAAARQLGPRHRTVPVNKYQKFILFVREKAVKELSLRADTQISHYDPQDDEPVRWDRLGSKLKKEKSAEQLSWRMAEQ